MALAEESTSHFGEDNVKFIMQKIFLFLQSSSTHKDFSYFCNLIDFFFFQIAGLLEAVATFISQQNILCLVNQINDPDTPPMPDTGDACVPECVEDQGTCHMGESRQLIGHVTMAWQPIFNVFQRFISWAFLMKLPSQDFIDAKSLVQVIT